MRILSVNCGSSSFKVELIELGDSDSPPRRVASGLVDRIGAGATVEFRINDEKSKPAPTEVSDHNQAMGVAVAWLREKKLLSEISGIGHRIVHGGDRFPGPALIDQKVIEGIDALRELAPLHNGPSLSAIRAARAELGEAMPMVAVFDTSFHRTMPPRAAQYAIPTDWAQKYGIRRYGFHGIAHRDMAERGAALLKRPASELRFITLQLGNGCSAAAIRGGQSIDTTMGFTPLEGLVMGTRSGDLDPSVPGFIAEKEKLPVAEVERMLNRGCGLLGVSGLSRDMRELESAAGRGDARAELAIELFCYRVRKSIGAYLAILEGADAVIFGGGIGEHASAIRERICAPMTWSGLMLDLDRNRATVGTEGRISADSSAVGAYVIPVDEALVIARDTAYLISKPRK